HTTLQHAITCTTSHTPTPDPPSSPTRRSSDLIATISNATLQGSANSLFLGVNGNNDTVLLTGAGESVVIDGNNNNVAAGASAYRDRKSTRLNSGHLVSAYAVDSVLGYINSSIT